MSLRPKLVPALSLLIVLASVVVFALDRAGCSGVVSVTHTLRTVLTRADPDYDRLEADRRARAEHGERTGAELARPAPTEGYPAPYWTGYRGPASAGVYTERELLAAWPAQGPPRLWRHPIGGGWSSFAVAEGLAVTHEQRRDEEAVVAYDLRDGAEVWTHAYAARFEEPLGGEGPRATPLVVGARVVALGATGELRCLERTTGELVWRRNVLGDGEEGNLVYALSASPVFLPTIQDGTGQDEGEAADLGSIVVVTGAPGSARCVHTFALADGAPRWSALADKGAYATPVLTRLAGREQLIVATAERVVGLDPTAGELLWEYPWTVLGGLMNSQPVIVPPNRLLVSGGYGAGALMLELSCDEDAACVPQVVWRNKRLKAKFNSPVAYDGHVYGLDEGVLVCLDLETGKRIWKGGRFGYGQLLLTGDALVVISESGELARVAATPEGYREEVRIEAIDGTTWNVPALADGRLLVRNAVEMACFDLRPR